MKKLLTLIFCFVMLTTTQAASGPTVGEVKQKMGTTWVERDFENVTITDSDFPLYMDDFLQTGEDGAMNIEFVDGTKVTVAPNSELVIDEFAFDTDAVPIQVALAIAINVGTFTYESGSISKLGGDVALVTPTAIITVQGTAFSGTVEPNGRTTITLLPDSSGDVGRVTVRNEAGSTTIAVPFASVEVVGASIVPGPPRPLSTNARAKLFDLDTNEEIIEEKVDQQNDRRGQSGKLDNLNEEACEGTNAECMAKAKDNMKQEMDFNDNDNDNNNNDNDNELLTNDNEVANEVETIEQVDQKEETKELIQEEQKEEVIEFETQEAGKPDLEVFKQDEAEVDKKIEIMEVKEQEFEVGDNEVASDLEESLAKGEATIEGDISFDFDGDDVTFKDSSDIIEMAMNDQFDGAQNTEVVTEDIIVDDTVNTEIDTTYYDQWDDVAYDEEYGWVDENDQVSVWDATGETKMDYEDSKKMWAEMDQAYYDAIGCENNCDWESIDWDEVDYDNVDWEGLAQQQDETMAKYGLDTDWNNDYDTGSMDESFSEDIDVTDDVFIEVEKFEGDVTDDLDVWAEDDPELFIDEGEASFEEAQNDYYSGTGPYLITGKEDWCDPVWCTQAYIDESNEYAQMDWDMHTKFDSWTTDSKKIFNKLILNPQWYGDTESAPKPWTISALKNKYINEWGWPEWDIFWEAFYEWQDQGSYDNWETEYEELSIEDEYSFEENEIDEWEKDFLAGLTTEPDCIYSGYYWDKKNLSCGTEWVDNTGETTLVTSSGEIINYETGDITQTVTTTHEITGSSSITQTGRYSTYNNTADFTAHSGENGYKRIDREYDNHKARLTTNSITNFDVMIIQGIETQAMTAGTEGSRAKITIIQTK